MKLSLHLDISFLPGSIGFNWKAERQQSLDDLSRDEAFEVLNRSGFFGEDISAEWERNKLTVVPGGKESA